MTSNPYGFAQGEVKCVAHICGVRRGTSLIKQISHDEKRTWLKKALAYTSAFLAEKRGFEPRRRLTRPNGLANRPLRPAWVLLQVERIILRLLKISGGEGGIRTHAPFRTNGFQDRLVMTTSIPLRAFP